MKIISLWEPWSSLLATSQKRIETRGWSTDYRGPVAIHSTKGGLSQSALWDCCHEPEFFAALQNYPPFVRSLLIAKVFPHGHIIAVGDLVDCLPTESTGCLPGVFDDYPELKTAKELAFGDYHPGRFGLVFGNVMMLKTPVPFKSRQGKLLDLDADTVQAVHDGLPF